MGVGNQPWKCCGQTCKSLDKARATTRTSAHNTHTDAPTHLGCLNPALVVRHVSKDRREVGGPEFTRDLAVAALDKRVGAGDVLDVEALPELCKHNLELRPQAHRMGRQATGKVN